MGVIPELEVHSGQHHVFLPFIVILLGQFGARAERLRAQLACRGKLGFFIWLLRLLDNAGSQLLSLLRLTASGLLLIVGSRSAGSCLLIGWCKRCGRCSCDFLGYCLSCCCSSHAETLNL